LPAPFWAYGVAFRCFGAELGVARATAIALSLAATVLVYVAARVLGASKLGALLGAAFSSLLLPYSAYLGIAALPEVPCAALMLFGAATLARDGGALRAWGALALLIGCLSRYEAWPIAGVFAGLNACDAVKQRRPALLGCALLALAGPLAWLALGRIEHGQALFFVSRVTSYRRALGGNEVSLLRRILEYPVLLFAGAAELSGLLLLVSTLTRRTTPEPLRYRRCALTLLGMLAFLILGSVRDGVPTHHAGRVLLPIWFLGCVIAGARSATLATQMPMPARAITGLAVLGWTWLMTPFAVPSNTWAHREAELEVGTAARELTSSALAIDTPDYGYCAVQAAFGSPAATSVLDDHDPRHPSLNPFSDAATLDRALETRHARFVVLTLEHAPLLAARCREQWRSARFALFACAPAAG
jgi:hypothetical protein